MHVYVGGMRRIGGPPVTLEEARQHGVGLKSWADGTGCVREDAPIRILDIKPAEVPDDPEWDVTFLETVQVLS